MTKLDYSISEEDIKTLDQLRKSGSPAMVIMTLHEKECSAGISETMEKDAIPADSNPVSEFKKLAIGGKFNDSPCIVIFNYDTINKLSQAKKQVIGICKWVPDSSPMRPKMKYTSAWNCIKQELTKAHLNSNAMFEISDWDDMEEKLQKL